MPDTTGFFPILSAGHPTEYDTLNHQTGRLVKTTAGPPLQPGASREESYRQSNEELLHLHTQH